MSYKKISLKTIAMMMAISIVCTSVPVYAEEIEEYIAEASDSENTSGGDSGSEVSGSLVITVEETSDSASGNTSEEVMNEVPDNEETVIEEPAIEETPGIENSEANDISIDTQVQTSGTSDISTETAVQNGEVYNQPFTDFIQGTENQYTKTIESFSTSESSNGRYNATFVLSEKNEQTGEIKTYNYTVSGFVSSEDASMYVNAMTSNPLASSQLMYSVESQNLVDAEKNPWKYDSNGNESPDDAYDSELCWAGTTSNMLELSGWNNAISSNTVNISNEDKIMDLYANVFTDAAGNPTYGLNWFFSGYYRAQEFDGWAHLKQDDYKGNGFLKEYCVDDFVKPENSITEDNLIGILNRLDVDGDGDRCALGMVFGYYTMDDNGQHIYDKNGEMNRDGGHVVTIVGYSTDENGIPTTITIADSDSYNDTFPGYSMGNDRTTYPNMYRTYPIKYYDGYWHIINYSYNRYDNIIDNITSIKYYGNSTKDIKDSGTHNVIESPDFKIYYQNVFKGENYYETIKSVYQGERLYAALGVFNYSYYRDDENYDFKYRFVVTKDGEVIRTLDYSDPLECINDETIVFYDILMDENNPLEPGEYTVSFIVNYDRSIEEAYYNNNKSDKTITFIVLKRVDENGDVHYVVVPNEEVHDNNSQEEYKVAINEFVRNLLDYTVVTDHSIYINDVNKVFECVLPSGIIESNVTEDQLQAIEILYDYSVTGDIVAADGSFGGKISSNIVITKDDFHIERNTDGSWKLVFTNEFMRKLPKGAHYFKIKIAGKVYIFKIEVI